MAKQTRRLGKGLDALISTSTLPPAGSSALTETAPPPPGQPAIRQTVPIDSILPNPRQPRRHAKDSGIETLARSIKANGVLQPILVRPKGDKFELVVGERRWRACRVAGLDEVPISVRDVSDDEMLELALVENIQREDLNAIDRAQAYRAMRDELGLTPEQIAQRTSEDRTTVTNYIRLLELAPAVQDLVVENLLSMGHARALAGLSDHNLQEKLARAVMQRDLSVRALENLVRQRREETRPQPATGRQPDPHIQDLERRFSEATGTKVVIMTGRKPSTGRITIEYYSLDDFDRICDKMGVAPES